MSTSTRCLFALLALTVFVGAGCARPSVSTSTDEKAANSLSFSSGDQMIVRETFLGIGGKVVNLLGGTGEVRALEFQTFSPEVVEFTWSMTFEQETATSVDARNTYDAHYANAPIGTEIPEPPSPQFENATQIGSLVAEDMQFATHIALPHFWIQEDQRLSKNSLLWLTKQQYQELAERRQTTINLGLFDNSLAYAESLSDRAQDLAAWLTQSETEAGREDVLTVRADEDWGTYDLSVNGERTTVRTIEAQNGFARYTILANENNPLILEIVLSPLSRGSINVFGRKNLLESFVGYEVVSITQNETSNEDLPQP